MFVGVFVERGTFVFVGVLVERGTFVLVGVFVERGIVVFVGVADTAWKAGLDSAGCGVAPTNTSASTTARNTRTATIRLMPDLGVNCNEGRSPIGSLPPMKD